MKKFLFLLCLLNVYTIGYSQDADFKRRANDAFTEITEGKLSLHFIDAITGNPIQGAKVIIEGIIEGETDFKGSIKFEPKEANVIYKIFFEHPKYIPTAGEIEIMAGTLFLNRFSISPILEINNLRIVVDWADKPADLDANLVKTGGYHISYRTKKVSDDGEAQLDRDDRDGNGPETITVYKTNHYDKYQYYIEDFTNRSKSKSKDLSKSRAIVRVYGEGRLMMSVQIDRNAGRGNHWDVFEIVNGQIIVINQLN